MECKKCGVQTVDGAVYCHHCGERLDGKKQCKTCGAWNEESFAFCIQCGVRTEEGQGSPAPEARVSAWQSVKTVFERLGGGFAMFGVLFSLICVFLIEFKVEGLSFSGGGIFYFFSDVFKEVKNSEPLVGSWDSFFQLSGYAYGIIGLVVSILTLASVLAFSIVAITIYVRNWLGRTQKKADIWAVLAVFSYFAGCALLFGLNQAVMEGNALQSAIGTTSVKTAFNGITTAGLIIGVICLLGYFVCKLLCLDKESWQGKKMSSFLFSALSLVVVVVVVCLITNGGMEMIVTDGVNGYSIKMCMCYPMFGSMIMTMFDGFAMQDSLYATIDTFICCGIVAQIAAVVVLVFSTLSLINNFNNLTQKKCSSGIVWSSVALLGAIALLVFALISENACEDIFVKILTADDLNYIEFKHTIPIVALVLTTLDFAVSVVRLVLFGKSKKRKQTA